jgi:hypothetical protein
MTYPLVRSVPAAWPLGPAQPTDNLTGLASGQAKGLGRLSAETLGLVTPLADLILPPWTVTTGSGSVSGAISRYLLLSEDGNLWPGGIDPTATADQSALLAAWLLYDPVAASAALLDALAVTSGSTAYYFRWHSIQGLNGNVARYAAIVVSNNSGQPLSAVATSHSATYATDAYSSS